MLQLLQNAVYGTAMVLAVMVLRAVLKDRLAPAARLALWAVCLFRLLTPAAPESVLSLWGLVKRAAPAEIGTQSAPAAPVPGPVLTPEAGAPVIYNPSAAPDMAASAAQAAAAPAAPAGIPWGTVLAAVWLAVGIAVALWYAAGWLRTRRAVGCAVPVTRGDERYRFLPRFARLREGPMDGAPLTFGAARPTVVLSPGLEGEELECVLAHEGVHASRRDNLWHYVMAAALVVHWWNPAVWVMSRLLRRDVELSCDRAALKKLGEGRRAQYAQALVTMATQESGPAFCQTFGRKATEERVLSIMKFKKTTVLGVVLSLVLVVGITIAFASDPKAQPDEDSTTSSAPSELYEKTTSDSESGALLSYEVSLEYLEKNLAEHVADGSMTQAEADRVLEQAKEFSEDGKALVWSFQGESGLTRIFTNEQRGVRGTCYRDKYGNWVPVDAATVVSWFIFPAAGELGGTTYNPNDYEVRTPVYDEDGNSLVYDENGELVIVGTATASVPGGAGNITPEEYAAMLDKWVAQGAMGRTEAGDWLEMFQTAYDRVQAGDTAGFGYNIYNGTKISSAWYVSERAAGYPVNSRGETYGPDLSEVYGSSPDLVLAVGTKGEEGYIRERDVPGANVKNPEEALEYMEWLKTQPATIYIPLYDCEGNVIGQFGVGNPEVGSSAGNGEWPVYDYPTAEDFAGAATAAGFPVCHVDGCTAVGQHTHNGTVYCGGADHHGDTCDGGCVYQTAASTPAGGHHEEEPVGCPPEVIDRNFANAVKSSSQYSSGHHSESHSSSHH